MLLGLGGLHPLFFPESASRTSASPGKGLAPFGLHAATLDGFRPGVSAGMTGEDVPREKFP